MEPLTIGIIGVVMLLVLLALGVHLGIVLGAIGLVGAILIMGLKPALYMATGGVYYFVTEYTFVVLPLFILMGFMAASGGIASRLYDSFETLFGRIRGASAIATVSACAAFGTITGSAIAAAATFTRVSAPQLRRLGYDKSFTYGMIAASGAIAMLIPPSAIAIIYGVLSGESVGKLLLAGIGPGVLMSALFIAAIIVMGWVKPSLIGTTRWEAVGAKEMTLAVLRMWPAAVVALVIIGGIYIGFCTVVEAGAIGALIILLIGIFSRQLGWKDIRQNLFDTITVCIQIFFIFFCARVFSRFLAISGISVFFSNTLIDLNLSPLLFVIGSSVIFILFGCLLDSVSMLCIFIPLLAPIVNQMGIDPIWYAIVVIVAIHVGLITPPVGLNVYAAVGAAERDVTIVDVFRGVMPFFFLMLGVLAIVIAFPQISTIFISGIG